MEDGSSKSPSALPTTISDGARTPWCWKPCTRPSTPTAPVQRHPHILGTTHYHVELEAELAGLRQGSGFLLFASRLCQRSHLQTLQKILPA